MEEGEHPNVQILMTDNPAIAVPILKKSSVAVDLVLIVRIGRALRINEHDVVVRAFLKPKDEVGLEIPDAVR